MLKKTNLALVALASSFALLVFACKKDSDKSPQEMVQGKWNFKSTFYFESFNGASFADTDTGEAGEYGDFRADGKLYTYIDGDYDTIDYKVLSATSILYNGDTATIKTLTDNQLTILYSIDNDPYYYEWTFNFEK